MNKIDTIYFDLFFTLVNPVYSGEKNENDVLGILKNEWEKVAEDEKLYYRRGTGLVKFPKDIIEEILRNFDVQVSDEEKKEILSLRIERFKNALTKVDEEIISTLVKIKEKGIKLCLISNADKIDILHWEDSPLAKLFNEVIFSCDVGILKPDKKIYEIALEKMNAEASQGIFIGDGGSDELLGAKSVGLNTIMVSHLLKREFEKREKIKENADYCVENFREILDYI